jgi:hypothetical protein
VCVCVPLCPCAHEHVRVHLDAGVLLGRKGVGGECAGAAHWAGCIRRVRRLC